MRRLVATLIAGALLALVFAAVAQPALAQYTPRKIAGGVEATNGTGVAKTDFEMVVAVTDMQINCVGTGLGAGLRINGGSLITATVTGNNTNKVTFSWTVAIANGDAVAAGFVCTQPNNNNFTVSAYFTPRDDCSTIAGTGWAVSQAGAVDLANSIPSAIAFSDLRFQFPTSVTISDMLSLVTGPSTGTPAAVPSGIVPAGRPDAPGRLRVDPDPHMVAGNFLTGRMGANFATPVAGCPTPNPSAVVVMGHEAQGWTVGGVAEAPDTNGALPASTQSSGSSMPMYALFAGIGLVAVAGTGWYARRRRHS